MKSRELFEAGLVTDERALIFIALVDAGWPDEEAIAMLDRHANPSARPRAWTQEEDAVLQAAAEANGGFIPDSAEQRALADQLGRTPKSVLSHFERMGIPFATRQRGRKAAS